MRIIFFIYMVLLVGCGSEEEGDETSLGIDEYPSSAEDGGHHEIDPDMDTPADEPSAVEDEGQCLAGSCQLDTEATFNFAHEWKISPDACEDIKKIEVFYDLAPRIFLTASCGEGPQLYHYSLTTKGNESEGLTRVSLGCGSDAGGVANSSVAQSSSGYGVAYECKRAAKQYDRYFASLDDAGHIQRWVHFETISSSQGFEVAWNDSVAAYGIARSGMFHRFDSGGRILGGPVFIKSDRIHKVRVYNGSWIILHSSYSQRNRCSKVSGIGTLLCNGKTISSGTQDFFGDVSLVADSRFSFRRASFDSEDCTTGYESESIEPSNRGYTGNLGFSGIQLTSDLGAYLYATPQNLVLAAFSLGGAFSLKGESSVTGFSDLTSASMAKGGNRLYIGYVRDQSAYLRVSQDEIR